MLVLKHDWKHVKERKNVLAVIVCKSCILSSTGASTGLNWKQNVESVLDTECISIHCGQTGIQWGLSNWDLFNEEHNVTSCGKIGPWGDFSLGSSLYCHNPNYRQLSGGIFKPRALFIDCDDNVLEDPYYGLKLKGFECNQRILGTRDCANIFGKGVGSNGKSVLEKSLEELRSLLEECETPQGILYYHSLGGGTGSGLTTLLSRAISQQHPELKCHEFSLLPGADLTSSATDVYNSILGIHNSLDTMGCSFVFDSDVIFNICFNQLHINNPNHFVLNTLLARVVSDVTATIRFPSMVNGTMESIECNLLPIQGMPFPLAAIQPLNNRGSECSEEHFKDIVLACYDKSNQLLNCNPLEGKIIRSSLVLRGQIDMEEVTFGLNELRSHKDFRCATSAAKTHTTCLLHSKLVDIPNNVVSIPRIEVCTMSNTTAIRHIFQNLTKRFDAMFQQKAFLHWYFEEGMEQQEFIDAREDIESLIINYKNAERLDHSS